MPTGRHDPLEFRADLARRLRCAEGHLRAIAGMIEIDADCQAVLQQMVAVQGALREVNRRLVKHYLEDCLPTDLQASDPALRQRVLENVVALYELIGGHPRPLGRKGIP
jgi:DNA-binding FrmR family transcriptional regulator